MTFHSSAATMLPRHDVPLAGLLDVALPRLRRQAQYARPLARGGAAAAGLQDLLGRAGACVAALARPVAFFAPVAARPVPGGVCIAGRVMLDAPDLARDVAAGGAVTAYLLTLGYGQGTAFDRLGGDYGAHHVQSDLAGDVLFALGRHAHRMLQAQNPGIRLRRVPVQASDLCGARRVWDPARVQALLGVFDAAGPGVSVTDTGCFQPLHSLLGLTVSREGARDQTPR